MNASKPLPRSIPGESFWEYAERINRLGFDPPAIEAARAYNRVHGTGYLRLVVDNTQETRQ